MNPQERLQHLEGLLDKLLQAVEIVGASGEQLSDEFQGLIAEEISYLWNEINQLKSAPPEQPTEPTFPTNPDEEEVEEPQGTPPVPPENIPPLEQAPHESSNVNAFGYDRKNKRMYVQFHGPYPQSAGSIYSYEGVDPSMFKLIQRGAVAPRTSGKNRYHEWFEGVTPSHGASVNHILKEGGYQYSRLS